MTHLLQFGIPLTESIPLARHDGQERVGVIIPGTSSGGHEPRRTLCVLVGRVRRVLPYGRDDDQIAVHDITFPSRHSRSPSCCPNLDPPDPATSQACEHPHLRSPHRSPLRRLRDRDWDSQGIRRSIRSRLPIDSRLHHRTRSSLLRYLRA